MKLREISVQGFRNLVDVKVFLNDTTVLVGENNSGKTSLLRALQAALPRATPGRGSPFSEYDYYMAKHADSPQAGEGITIELWFREDVPDEWPTPLVQALSDIIQTDPERDLDSIGLRLSSKYEAATKEMVSRWEFLDASGNVLGGRAAQRGNLTAFLQYVRLFYLTALRDSDEEFSARSQYWGRILRDLKIADDKQKELADQLSKLNDELLKADPRLGEVVKALGKAQDLMALGPGQGTSIQALPLRPWDLMSRSEVVIKTSGSEVHFPLSSHGQGIQSLAVLFLFEAYIEVLLKPSFRAETEAIIALEEPEAHLHPQATRALAANLSQLKSQKVISTHSPYFIQEIPFSQIRMFRRRGAKTKVCYVARHFVLRLPDTKEVEVFCSQRQDRYAWRAGTGTLTVRGVVIEKEYRELLTIYAQSKEAHPGIKRLYEESQWWLSDAELAELDTYAKRIRGEVLFARAWLLCEGQSDYTVLRCFAEMLGKPFDRTGVAVIDYQNNGSPELFVALARAFEMPWVMVCDNDDAGRKHCVQVASRGLSDTEKARLRLLPGDGSDLEAFLSGNGFLSEYEAILSARGVELKTKPGEAGHQEEVAARIRQEKPEHARALVERLRATGAGADRVPSFLRETIEAAVASADQS